MKSNNTYPRNDRHRAGNSCTPHTHRQPRPNKFEIMLNRFFYRLFGGLSLFIFIVAIYAGEYHQLFTAAITAAMAWVIYDQNKKNKR